MLADARADLDEAQARLLHAARQLPALRETLVAARETLLWVAAYPQPTETFGFPHALALGLQKPVKETLGTKARIDYTQLATAFSRGQSEKLGRPVERTPETDAMWDSEIPIEWKRHKLEEAQRIAAYSLTLRWSPPKPKLRPSP